MGLLNPCSSKAHLVKPHTNFTFGVTVVHILFEVVKIDLVSDCVFCKICIGVSTECILCEV